MLKKLILLLLIVFVIQSDIKKKIKHQIIEEEMNFINRIKNEIGFEPEFGFITTDDEYLVNIEKRELEKIKKRIEKNFEMKEEL